MTNQWADPLASTLGSQVMPNAVPKNPFGQAQAPASGGFGGLRDQAMARLNPQAGGIQANPAMSMQPVGAPQQGQNWGDIMTNFQNQMNTQNQAFQAQQTAWQQQMQQMMAQQAQQQSALQQPQATPAAASPYATGGTGGSQLYGVQVPWDQLMQSYAAQSAQHALENGA